jgi:mannose-6-phosphate isomerase-like protein (cupin superfamily)
MTAFVGDIEKLTEMNDHFREVLFTAKYTQLVVMCLKGGDEIGREVHDDVDQFFRIEEGEAEFIFNAKERHLVKAGSAVIVPAGTVHNVINLSKTEKLKLYTLYSPPNHPNSTIHATKSDAEAAEEHHN